MKTNHLILFIALLGLFSNIQSQNLTKEQCLKYLCDMNNELNLIDQSDACPLENFRLEYENIKWEKHCDNSHDTKTFGLSGLYIEQPESGNIWTVKNSKGEIFNTANYSKPAQKERLEKVLKALKYLSQFATKDPFAN